MLIPLSKELNHLQAYLSLEQARFPGKYKISLEIERGLEDIEIPPFVAADSRRKCAPPCIFKKAGQLCRQCQRGIRRSVGFNAGWR